MLGNVKCFNISKCLHVVIKRKTWKGISVIFSHLPFSSSTICSFQHFSFWVKFIPEYFVIGDAISSGTFFLIAWTECSVAVYRNIMINMQFLHTDLLCNLSVLTYDLWWLSSLMCTYEHMCTHACSFWGFHFLLSLFIYSLYNPISTLPLLPVPPHESSPHIPPSSSL